MKPWMVGLGVIVLVSAGAAGGFWIGQSQHEPASASQRKVLYYRNPMGQPDVSAVPKKDSMGMDYIPVYADQAPAPPPQDATAKAERRVLYYRNPMGQPDTSPVPKKDSMGMDYIPVRENALVASHPLPRHQTQSQRRHSKRPGTGLPRCFPRAGQDMRQAAHQLLGLSRK